MDRVDFVDYMEMAPAALRLNGLIGYDEAMRKCLFIVLSILLLASGAWCAPELMTRGGFEIAFHPDDRAVAAMSLATLEAAIEEFTPPLERGTAPIRVVIAHSFEEFMGHAKAWSQVSVSGIARPWKGLIVVKGPRLRKLGDDYEGTLRHELVHVLLYRTIETAYMPKWLNEGLAMSLANEHRWMSSWQVARMFVGNRMIDYRDLDTSFLAPGNEMEFNDAYAQALSMTRFLRNRLGEERFWELVLAMKTLDFPDAMRKAGDSTPAFWHDYQHSLWRLALIGMMASGSLFTPGAFLLVAAWWRVQRRNRHIVRRWEAEEAAEAAGGAAFHWEEVVEDPDAWKEEEWEEEESW